MITPLQSTYFRHYEGWVRGLLIGFYLGILSIKYARSQFIALSGIREVHEELG